MPAAARTRRGLPWPALVALFVAMPIAEVWLLVQAGRAIGPLPTIATLVVEAMVGAWLMKREGSRAWQNLNAAVGQGRLPSRELTDAALVLVGGLLLMLPGFVTDVVGLVFLVPFTRPLARSLVGMVAAKQVSKVTLEHDLLRARGRAGMTVPGEVVDEQSAPGGTQGARQSSDVAGEITGRVI